MARKTDDASRTSALQQLKADLKTGQLKTCYVLYGEEGYLRECYVKMLVKKLTDGPAGDFNYHRFTADTLTPEALAEAVEAMPMMAERTLVQIDDVDLFKQPEAARELYRTILSDIPDYCCVALVYDTVEFKINGQMKKLAETLRSKAQLVEFAKRSERELSDWIARQLRKHDKLISPKLCEYLIFITDGMMSTLGGEIEKIAAYAGGQEIQKSDIDAVVIPALSAQTFDISNAIADGDYARALQKTQELLAMQESCIGILGAVGAQIRRLCYAKTIAACGKGQQTLMELAKLQSFAASRTMAAANKLSAQFCRKAVELCLTADEQMKSSYDEPERILELLIMQLSAEARRG